MTDREDTMTTEPMVPQNTLRDYERAGRATVVIDPRSEPRFHCEHVGDELSIDVARNGQLDLVTVYLRGTRADIAVWCDAVKAEAVRGEPREDR